MGNAASIDQLDSRSRLRGAPLCSQLLHKILALGAAHQHTRTRASTWQYSSSEPEHTFTWLHVESPVIRPDAAIILSLCKAAHSYCVDAKNEWHAHPHVLGFVFPFTDVFYYCTLVMFSNRFFPVLVQVVGVTVIPTMVQKYQSPVRVYKHPFELVMAVSVSTCTSVDPLSTWILQPCKCSYVMLVDGCCRGYPQRVVIELHTLCVIGSLVGNAVAEGKLLFAQ